MFSKWLCEFFKNCYYIKIFFFSGRNSLLLKIKTKNKNKNLIAIQFSKLVRKHKNKIN